MSCLRWLLDVLDLFSDTLYAVADVEIFAFFLAFMLFCSVAALTAQLVRMTRKGKI